MASAPGREPKPDDPLLPLPTLDTPCGGACRAATRPTLCLWDTSSGLRTTVRQPASPAGPGHEGPGGQVSSSGDTAPHVVLAWLPAPQGVACMYPVRPGASRSVVCESPVVTAHPAPGPPVCCVVPWGPAPQGQTFGKPVFSTGGPGGIGHNWVRGCYWLKMGGQEAVQHPQCPGCPHGERPCPTARLAGGMLTSGPGLRPRDAD